MFTFKRPDRFCRRTKFNVTVPYRKSKLINVKNIFLWDLMSFVPWPMGVPWPISAMPLRVSDFHFLVLALAPVA